MSNEKYKEILQNNLLHLPVANNGKCFRDTIAALLNGFLSQVNELSDDPIPVMGINAENEIDGCFVKDVQQKLIEGLLDTIDLYHDGKPFKAFERLSNTLVNELKNYMDIFTVRTYSPVQSFQNAFFEGEFPLDSRGHCPYLKDIFELTESISWQMYQNALGGGTFVGSFGDEKRGVNAKIEKLELIKGRAYPYSYSTLGKLESFLEGMPTYPF